MFLDENYVWSLLWCIIWQRGLVEFICSVFVASWTGVVRYHGPRPSRRPKQVYPLFFSNLCIYSDNFYLLVGAQALYGGLFLCSRFGLMSKMFSQEVSHFMHDTGHVMWFWRVLRLAEPNLESWHPILPTMVWSFGIDSIELVLVGALQYIISTWLQYFHAQYCHRWYFTSFT